MQIDIPEDAAAIVMKKASQAGYEDVREIRP
jgi:hypothetical protein